MKSANPSYGDLEISGNLSRSVISLINDSVQKETQANMDAKSGDDFRLANIRRLIQDNETEIRSEMDGIYINKTKQIINTGRLREEYMTKDEKLNF